MVERIRRFEYIVTDSELEALVLECNLIKEHRPKYNTMLKDDKTYPFIKVTLGEEYPRVLFSRTMKKDKSRYFGPYTSAGAVKDTIDLIKKLYKIRSCSKTFPRDIGKERPCLYYHIGQCNAPCQGSFTKEQYRESVAQAVDFLAGNHAPVVRMLEEKMNQALTIVSAVTLVAYVMYTVSDDVMKQFNSHYIYLTTVFVLAGILRYLQITIVDVKSGSPTKVLMKDRFVQLCIVGWVISFLILIYL